VTGKAICQECGAELHHLELGDYCDECESELDDDDRNHWIHEENQYLYCIPLGPT
jgi:predicted amidophosphoribosyltransferase